MYHSTFMYSLIFLMLLTSSMISMTINNMLIIWFLMELNNFTFLCYLALFMKNKKMIFLYFFVQATSSLLFVLALLINVVTLYATPLPPTLMLMISLMLKIGLPPFHLWLPVISMYMNWNMIFAFLSIQKIIPLIILSNLNFHSSFYSCIIFSCMILPPFMMLYSNLLKKIMAYASINQTGWMILLIFSCPLSWLLYMFLYSFSLIIIVSFLELMKINYFSSTKSSSSSKLLIVVILMNMSGLPPFSFFIIKWYTILLFMLQMNHNFMVLIMLLSSILMTYIYINMLIKFSFTYVMSSKLTHPFFSKHVSPAPTMSYILLLLIFMSIMLIMT